VIHVAQTRSPSVLTAAIATAPAMAVARPMAP
jgi:hypothetical protein